eukprot:1161075-Pelagomonas_calceolata.AAC.11
MAICGLTSQLWVSGRTFMRERPQLSFALNSAMVHCMVQMSMQMDGELKAGWHPFWDEGKGLRGGVKRA